MIEKGANGVNDVVAQAESRPFSARRGVIPIVVDASVINGDDRPFMGEVNGEPKSYKEK